MNSDMRAPLVARLSGIPSEVMQMFTSHLHEHLMPMQEMQTTLQAARSRFVDVLYKEIHGAEPELRHALLAVKRDCFNNRPLSAYREKAIWKKIVDFNADLAEQIIALESRIEVLERNFIQAFADEKEHQLKALPALLQEPRFLCGLAISSAVVGKEVGRLRDKPLSAWGRREARLVATLLRYASRAALKLSPFATFTSVGLTLTEESAAPVRLLGGDWARHSLVRLRRHILDRCVDMLLRCPAWRRELHVAVNSSVVSLAGGMIYRQSTRFRPDDETATLRYCKEAIVRARFNSKVADKAAALLAVPLSYQQLIQALAQEGNGSMSRDEVAKDVDRLIEVDFLQLIVPWSSDDPYLERTILRYFLGRAKEMGAETFVEHLQRLVDLEEGFLTSTDPVADISEMDRLIQALLRAASVAAQLDPSLDVTNRASQHDIYQDVWCSNQRVKSEAIAKVGVAPLLKALDNLQPLVTYSRLYDRRQDFLHSLGVLLRQKRGGGRSVPLLEAFELALPLWQGYQAAERNSTGEGGAWNPLGSPTLEELSRARRKVDEEFAACLHDGPEGRTVASAALQEILRNHVPEEFRNEHVGACLFLQPANPDGSLWVLNHLTDGTGRMASRYSALMPPAIRAQYGRELRSRGKFMIDHETVQALDLYCVQGDTLNVHGTQTPKTLTMPGSPINLPEHLQLRLQDLLVQVADDSQVCLRDRQGQRYLPFYLGGAGHRFLPRLVRFLSTFGPGELNPIFPPVFRRDVAGLVLEERTTMGNVVITRKSWQVPLEVLRRLLSTPTEASAFLALSRWRYEHGVPDRVFINEKTEHWILGTRYKPQYIDFTSPLFVSLLHSIVMAADHPLVFTEMLPQLTDFPKDKSRQAWAVELLVDDLALRVNHAEFGEGRAMAIYDESFPLTTLGTNNTTTEYWRTRTPRQEFIQ